jgi:hypothetical protein
MGLASLDPPYTYDDHCIRMKGYEFRKFLRIVCLPLIPNRNSAAVLSVTRETPTASLLGLLVT